MRILNRFYAWFFGYFWAPCKSCGEFMGGHEWTSDDSLDGKAICNKCSKLGKGNCPWRKYI